MDAQDMRIIESYENLINDYSTEHSCAFLKACWLLDERAKLQSGSLARLIFSEGDSQEIYTPKERDFVSSFAPDVDYECFQMFSGRSAIDCRVISVELALSCDAIYDSIQFMKIFNKAFKGFNVFSFCCANGVHLGCSCVGNRESDRDCMISPLITPNINWNLLINTLLYREVSTSPYTYFQGMYNTIYEIQYCFELPTDRPYKDVFSSYVDDDDPVDRLGRIRLSDYSEHTVDLPLDQNEVPFDVTQFDSVVEECFTELAYIKPLRANPLEMLFEAEAVLAQSQSFSLQNDGSKDFSPSTFTETDIENFELLNDPATLVKKLKAELIAN